MSEQLEQSKQSGGPHHLLARLTGDWEGATTTWFEPDLVGDESPWRGTMRPLLDGRFVIHEYEGSMGGEALHGIAIFGYDPHRGTWQSAWMDDFHMGLGMLFSEGGGEAERFSVLGEYLNQGRGPAWGWRTEVQLPDDDHITITMWNILPTGESHKAVETRYGRVQSDETSAECKVQSAE